MEIKLTVSQRCRIPPTPSPSRTVHRGALLVTVCGGNSKAPGMRGAEPSMVYRSIDGGRTWKDWDFDGGHNLLRLRSGRLLAAFRHEREWAPEDLVARVDIPQNKYRTMFYRVVSFLSSDDDGRHWSIPRTVTRYNETPRGSRRAGRRHHRPHVPQQEQRHRRARHDEPGWPEDVGPDALHARVVDGERRLHQLRRAPGRPGAHRGQPLVPRRRCHGHRGDDLKAAGRGGRRTDRGRSGREEAGLDSQQRHVELVGSPERRGDHPRGVQENHPADARHPAGALRPVRRLHRSRRPSQQGGNVGRGGGETTSRSGGRRTPTM